MLLPKNTCNTVIYGETGMVPLQIKCTVRCVKYWLRLLDIPTSRYPKACYLMLKRMGENGLDTWNNKVKEI